MIFNLFSKPIDFCKHLLYNNKKIKEFVMDIIKRILVFIFILAGIALGGLIICAGVLVVFPSTKIFGYSYINNTTNPYSESFLEKDNALFNQSNNEYNIVINSKNFDIEVVAMEQSNMIDVKLKNNVIGFTNAVDSSKFAKTEQSYDSTTKTFVINVIEPNGLFVKRDTSVTVYLPKIFMKNNLINISTSTSNGKVTLGENSDNQLLINNLSCTCETYSGAISVDNCNILGSLKLNNILGKVNIEQEVSGTVEIDSKSGNYNFKKIKNLIVKASSNKDEVNSPHITVDEVENVNYSAEGGSLIVNNYVLNNLQVISKSAKISINTVVKEVYIKNSDSIINIQNIGNFTDSPTSKYNSWNYKQDSSETENINSVKYLETDNGQINIGKSYYSLQIVTKSASISVSEAYKKVIVQGENPKVDVNFYNGTLLNTSGITTQQSEKNKYINEKIIGYLSNLGSGEYALSVSTKNGSVKASNINGAVNISGEKASVELDYITVKGKSLINVNNSVKVNAPISDFVLQTVSNKSSKAKFVVKFGSIDYSSYPKLSGNRVLLSTDDKYKVATILVNNASASEENSIVITNLTGSIEAVEKM